VSLQAVVTLRERADNDNAMAELIKHKHTEQMKSTDKVKTGDYIQINNVDGLVKDYLKEKVFENLDVQHLRVVCRVVSEKKYLVADVCKPCKSVRIKVGKDSLAVRYKHITKVTDG